MKKISKLILCSIAVLMICGCTPSSNADPKPSPIYSYVYNNDSPIKLNKKLDSDAYFVTDLLFNINDKIKFVDTSVNPYKLVEGISISGERYGFKYLVDSFKASEKGTYSFDLSISDNGNKLVISKKEEPVINYYTVTFDANGHGAAPSPITNVKEGSIISKPADPSASGYIFEGWYKESSCTNAWNFESDRVVSNLTLYAKWSLAPVEKYTVTFDTQGHGVAPANQIIEKGGKVTKPTDPSASGYIFEGWYKESSCTNAWNFESDRVVSNLTLYAKWSLAPVEKYTVTFDTQGHGVAPANQIIEKGGKVTKPTDPIEEGFQFMGWYKEKSCINAWNFNIDKVTSNVTLFAKWEEVFERYFIVFNTGDVPYDLNDGVEFTRKSSTLYTVSLSTDVIQPGLRIKFKDSKNNIYSGFNLETNAFENYLIKKISDSIQFIAYGKYSFSLNPENLTSGISITCSTIKAHLLYEVNMNASYYYDLSYISSTDEKIIYKYSSFKFGKNYSYSIRTVKSNTSIFENIVFSSTTNTKRFVLNGTSFVYTADGEIGKNYKYDVTLTIYSSDLSLEVDIRTA